MPSVDFEPTFTHYRLLYQADSACLPELLDGYRSYGFADDYEWAPLSLREARSALVDLVDAGLIDVFSAGAEPLSKSKALVALKDDASWKTGDPHAPDYYEIKLNEDGFTALEALRPKFRHIGLIEKGK